MSSPIRRATPIQIHLARLLDRFVETIALAGAPDYLHEPRTDVLQAWPEAVAALRDRRAVRIYRFAPDRTPFLSAARPMFGGKAVLLATGNPRDITEIVRAERLRIFLVLAAAIIASILLSLFLARTIVLPLRRLAQAAVRVRLGRAREVIVPRLPDRRGRDRHACPRRLGHESGITTTHRRHRAFRRRCEP